MTLNERFFNIRMNDFIYILSIDKFKKSRIWMVSLNLSIPLTFITKVRARKSFCKAKQGFFMT